MAQAQLAPDGLSGTWPSSPKLSDREIFEFEQYEKIIQLRDAILSGKHPTLKVPPGSNTSLEPLLLKKTVVESRAAEARRTGDGNGDVALTTPTKSISPGRPALNPIFLEKSDRLVRAELQIQRQRLEKAIREEVEQRRAAKSSQVELLSDLDLSDVLAKALVLVQSTSAPAAEGENLTANAEAISELLDDSTFYSSRHDTPESHLASIIRNQSEEEIPATNNQEHLGGQAIQQVNKPLPDTQTHAQTTGTTTEFYTAQPSEINDQLTAKSSLDPQISVVPGLNNYVQGTVAPSVHGQTTSTAARQGDQRLMEVEVARVDKPSSISNQPNEGPLDSHPPSPLVRNHALQPVAPQPTHPSALSAFAAASSAVHDSSIVVGHRSTVGTPAQVAALRTESNIATSPDSSSQGGKKKGKKKKRKADRQGPEPTAALYIKPEPRSPSPMSAPSYLRPNKRQRHDKEPSAADPYEPRYEQAQVRDPDVQYIAMQYREEPIPVGYARSTAQPPLPPSDFRYRNGEYYDVRQLRGEDLGPRAAQVEHPIMSYPTRATPASRPLSRVMVASPYSGSSRQYREYHDAPQIAGHAEGDTFIASSRPPTTRILVDAYGREYIEPPHHPPPRLSATSPSRHGEHEVLYERLPARAMSRHPAPISYDDGLMYAASNQAYVMPRRVVTQPEYATHDYRDVRQREISARPPLPHGEFVQVLAPPERRYAEDAYGAGPSSMRPMETVRYQLPADYRRVHSVRPEAQGATDFRASAHPDGHREVLQPYVREYRPGHAQEPVLQRGLSVRPGDRPPNGPVRGGEDIAFIERPHGATQEMAYADDVRREVYR